MWSPPLADPVDLKQRWPPVKLGARSKRCCGKIGDFKQFTTCSAVRPICTCVHGTMSGKQKQSSKVEQNRQGKKEGYLEMAHLSTQPPFNLLQKFFFFSRFCHTRKPKRLKKNTGIHHTDKKCDHFSFLAALLTLKANQLLFKIHLFCPRALVGELACLPRSYTKVPRCDDGIIVLPGSLAISPG